MFCESKSSYIILSIFSKCFLYRKQNGRCFLRESVAAAAATITQGEIDCRTIFSIQG